MEEMWWDDSVCQDEYVIIIMCIIMIHIVEAIL